ncbi:MAG: cation-transporting P-type ATPase, partial [Syntrophaceticus sp.]|nr:cation-transporting P-type ATPase [Syntrophaceticus sp.]MDD4360688.1 cation-transporting P-type ATPase [Syntrophaceticus sp.]MDD4783796.1 cation-transporting P-type ATPase [Syntrophaceticus sp.]
MQEQEWYRLDVAEAGEKLNTDLGRGLDTAEAEKRLEEYGPNALKESPGRSILSMFIDQLKEVLVIILIIAAVISGALGEWIDSL